MSDALRLQASSTNPVGFLNPEDKYRALFASIDAGFCIIKVKFDRDECPIDYQFLEVNPAFEKQTGITHAEGRWMRSIAPSHEQYWFDIYGRVALTGEPVRIKRQAAALESRWFEVYAFRMGHASDHHVAVLFNDISARHQAEEALAESSRQLQALTKELQRSNAELENFAHVAGHDLRAPLRSIIQFSQLLVRRYGQMLDEKGNSYLQHIIKGGQHMSRLLTDVMQYALLHRPGNAPPEPTPVQLACEQAVANLSASIEETRARVRCEIPAEAQVRLESSRLVQLLQNLIANGIHYRKPNTPPVIKTSARLEGSAWRFEVQDNGEGIEAQHFEQIFEPFRRLHGPERTGSGIGLATCQRIVEQAGGKIWVESVVGEGSTFVVELAQAPEDSVTPAVCGV